MVADAATSDIVPAQLLAIISSDIYINFVQLILQKVATGLINEVAA